MRQTQGWNLVLGLTSCAAMATVGGGLWIGIEQLRQLSCPEGTFLTGWSDLAGTLAILPSMFAALSCSYFVVGTWMFGGELEQKKSAKICALTLGPLAVGLTVAFGNSGFCVADDQLVLRTSTFAPARTYAWEEIQKIELLCPRWRRHVRFLTISFADDKEINLADSPSALAENSAAIHSALSRVSCKITSSYTDGNCPDWMENIIPLARSSDSTACDSQGSLPSHRK